MLSNDAPVRRAMAIHLTGFDLRFYPRTAPSIDSTPAGAECCV
jgi:hypothetical protein